MLMDVKGNIAKFLKTLRKNIKYNPSKRINKNMLITLNLLRQFNRHETVYFIYVFYIYILYLCVSVTECQKKIYNLQ